MSELVIAKVDVRFFSRGYLEVLDRSAPPFSLSPNQTLIFPPGYSSIWECIAERASVGLAEFEQPLVEVTVNTIGDKVNMQDRRLLQWSRPLARIAHTLRDDPAVRVTFFAVWECKSLGEMKLLGRLNKDRVKQCVVREDIKLRG